MNYISTDADRELLTRQLAWAANHIKEKRVSEIVRWVCVQLHAGNHEDTGSLAHLLLRLLRMDAEEQREAEKALCGLLDRRFFSQSPTWERSDAPRRNVDWGETYRRSLLPMPTSFINRATVRRPDTHLMGALVYQARQWRDLLRASDDAVHAARAEKLHDAMSVHLPELRNHMSAFSSPLLHRLRQQSPTAAHLARLLTRIYAHQQVPPKEIAPRVVQAIEESSAWITESDSQTDSAWHVVFELSILASISRAADSLPTWQLTELTTDDSFKAVIVHQSQPIELVISKSAPAEDTYKEGRERTGLTKVQSARDSQPDICLTFTNRETGENISVLGDAKRNAKRADEGASYFREGLRTATYYLAAYGHGLGARFTTEGPVGKLRPTFTLFFRQGVEHSDSVRDALRRRKASALPPILAFDVETHLSAYSERDLSVPIPSNDPLRNWVDVLTEQALDTLCKDNHA